MPVAIFRRSNKKSMTLGEVTALLSELKIPVSLVFTPINLAEEKEKFYESDTYEPQFKYRLVKNDNEKILDNLKSLHEVSDVDPRISDFYIQLIEEKKLSNDMMRFVGNNDKVTKVSVARYKMPTPILFRNACRVLRGMTSSYNVIDEKKYKSQKKLNFDDMVGIFETVFEGLGLEGWGVEESMRIADQGAKMGAKNKKIFLDPGIQRRPIELRKTIIHEVGTHALRSHNGFNSGFEALGKSNLPSYLDVEEGLAMYNEEVMGVLKSEDLKKRALMVWAIYIGKSMSFRQLYSAMLGIKSRNVAFDITYRVKRGLGDTSRPGIFCKDHVYFRGFRRVRKKIVENPALYNLLYAGKIGFKQVSWVDDGLIKKPLIVPSKQVFERLFKKAGI